MKKNIMRLVIVILIMSFINISAITAEAAVHTYNITLNVGEKEGINLRGFISNGDFIFYAPSSKYTISDPSIVGMDYEYNKKKDEWSNDIVALRPGTATIYQWYENKKIFKYIITVKRQEMDSITSYFGLVDTKNCDYSSAYYPEETDEAAQDILKDINIEQYNSDRERIAAISKYLYKNITYGHAELDQTPYAALVKKSAKNGIHLASALLLENLGFDLQQCGGDKYHWSEIKLEGINYIYDLENFIFNDFLMGSVCYDQIYAGDGTYTNEFGEILHGSLYYDARGVVSDWVADSYTNDIYNETICTHGTGFNLQTQEEKLCYLTNDRKSQLPAWLIGIETPEQIIWEGKSRVLPEDQLSSNVYSSDESIVKIKDNKIIGVRQGIAIVYRYNDTYCDAFYVVVDKKVTSKTTTFNFKADGKKYSTYKLSNFCAYRKVLNEWVYRRRELWKNSVLYKLDPIFNGGELVTTYKGGYLKAFIIDSNGDKQTLFDDTDYIDD